jgi:hypothetical protein
LLIPVAAGALFGFGDLLLDQFLAFAATTMSSVWVVLTRSGFGPELELSCRARHRTVPRMATVVSRGDSCRSARSRYRAGMDAALRIYLQNHEAAGRAGLDLSRRTARSQKGRSYGPQLRDLCFDIQEDLSRLRAILRDGGGGPNVVLGLALQAGERMGRLKPNGRVIRRAPLSDLLEIEALQDAVQAKRSGWLALAAAKIDPARVDELIERADEQIARLEVIHAEVAGRVFRA